MEPTAETTQPQFRSGISGPKPGELGFGFDEIDGLISGPAETDGTSFTALLELPPPQAVELLVKEDFPAKPMPPPIFPSNIALIDRASKFSVFADNPPESTNISTAMNIDLVKQEPLESESLRNSSSPAVSNQSSKSSKRKEREKKVISKAIF